MSNTISFEYRKKKEEKELFDEIRRCTQSVKKSSVEQTATMRAWSEKNQLNVEKFRDQVEKELEKTSKGDRNENQGFWRWYNFDFIDYLFLIMQFHK